jgi:hypothetical protein
MSCIRFNTTAQRAAMRQDGAGLSAADAAVLHLAPPVTESKIARLRLLAESPQPGIRQSVASNRHAPADLLEALAADADPAVRGEVARNETVPQALLAALAGDRDARVRCWAVLNPGLPLPVVARLAGDRDAQVRRLAGWRLDAERVAQPS